MKTLTLSILTAAVALSIGSPEVASAAGAKASAALCTPHIGLTKKVGNYILGSGSQARDCGVRGQTFLTIQRSFLFGWKNVATARIVGPGNKVTVKYNCARTGTHDYRTIHTGRTVGGGYIFKASNKIRVTCQ